MKNLTHSELWINTEYFINTLRRRISPFKVFYILP
jgi:hypothetical protein